MSIIIDVIEQPPAVIDVLQSTATVVEVLTPGGVAAVLSPLVYNPATQTLSFDQSLLTGLPPSAVTGTAVVNADPRLTNARTPTAHKATHATGGSDALTPADIGAEPLGAAASSMSSHLAAADPHPQYTTAAEAAAAAPVQSVAGKTGAVTLTPADVGADATGTAAAAVTAHEAAADPHTQYTTAARVRAVVLTGLSTAVNAAVTAADSILSALGKLQAQLTAHVGTGGAAHADATTSTAGFMAAADKTKLDGIAAGATANSSDAQLRDRSTHTGTQAINTVTGLQTALDGKEAVGTATNSMATHLAAADPHSQYTTAAEAAAAAPVQSVAGKTGTVTLAAADITDSTAAGRAVLTAADAAAQRTALGLVLGTDVQAYDADLQAIAALAGSSGLLRKTAANTWSLDTSSFLTGNQTVTVTGDASGSGATSIALTLANSGVAAGTYNDSATQVRPFTVDAKGRVTAVGAAVTITPAWASITGKPTTLSGYGITDAQPLDSDLTAIAALTHAADGFLVSDGTAWTRKTPADALVSLGLGTPTGTGNVVRATSPTLSSPTISGVLSLAAGTALLPSLAGPTDPDTGMWFPPGGNIVAWSTGGTERMRLTAAGDLGLGTTPGGGMKLDILGGNVNLTNGTYAAYQVVSGTVTGQLAANAGGTVDIRAVSNHALLLYTNNAERVRISSGGDIAIGTTDNANSRLRVRNDRAVNGYAQTWGTANGASFENDTVLGFDGSRAFFGNFQSFPLAFVTNNQERMRISSGGDVGIGTSSPVGKLDIVTGTHRGYFDDSAGSLFRLNAVNAANSAYAPLSLNGSVLTFQIAAFERMRITSAGRVGIGTTDPLNELHVIGNGRFQGNLYNVNGFATVDLLESATGVGFRWALANNGTFRLQRTANGTYSDATTPILFDASGNVGIGTTNPAVRLDVAEADITQLRAVATTNGVDTRLLSLGLSANAGVVGTYSNHPLAVSTNGQERMRIDSSGNVGIGTNNPAVKLEVAGQIRTEAPTGGTAANWRLGTVHTVSPTSPNRTIEVDIGGTIYYLHAKTTNN